MKKTEYICQNCEYSTPSWLGKCPQCGGWNTFKEITSIPQKSPKRNESKTTTQPLSLPDLFKQNYEVERRIGTSLSEVDRVLGGGIVEGSLSLLSGDPGIGKSTLLLAIAAGIARQGKKVLYVSTEESLHQLFIRVQRFGFKPNPNLWLHSTDSYNDIERSIENLVPSLMIIDSIQNLSLDEFNSIPGNISLIRDLSSRFMEISKKRNIAIFLVGHVTKEGIVAGPRTLEHLVDVVLYLDGEAHHQLRVLRSVKNRFGSTQEVGLLEMKEEGLVELIDPSKFFLVEKDIDNSSTARTVLAEGKRALLLEVQTLVNRSYLDYPRRVSVGFDVNRLHLLVAVIEKRLHLHFSQQDIYLNMAGGMKVTETTPDLAVCFSLISSRLEKSLSKNTIYLGEVGLGGEIRPVHFFEGRIQEAERMGISQVITSQYHLHSSAKKKLRGLKIIGYQTLYEAAQKEGLVQ